MDTFDTAQAQYDAALPDYYDNPGYDATPDYCALCDEPADDRMGPLVETPFGLMHDVCWESRPESEDA